MGEDNTFIRTLDPLTERQFRHRRARIWIGLGSTILALGGSVIAFDIHSSTLWVQALLVLGVVILPAFWRPLRESYADYLCRWRKTNEKTPSGRRS